MAVPLHARRFPRKVNGENLGKRYGKYVAKYKEAREFKFDSGHGLSEVEHLNGIALEEKVEKICPHFERRHSLFGGRPNIQPPAHGEFGRKEDDVGYVAIEGSDNDDNEDDMPTDPYVAPPSTPIVIIDESTPADISQDTMIQNEIPMWADMDEIARQEIGARYGTEPPPSEGWQSHQENNLEPSSMNSEADVDYDADVESKAAEECLPRKQKKTSLVSNLQQKKPLAGKENAAPIGSQGNAKPNMAKIYQKKLNLKADYRKELCDMRNKWKSAELGDRKVARSEQKMEAATMRSRQRKHDLTLAQKAATNAAKKAKADHKFHLAKVKEERKTQLLIKVLLSNKAKSNMEELFKLVEVVSISSSPNVEL